MRASGSAPPGEASRYSPMFVSWSRILMPSCLKRAVVSRAGCRRWIASISFLFLPPHLSQRLVAWRKVGRVESGCVVCVWGEGWDSLLCTLEHLDEAGDEADDEPDAREDVEESAHAPHYARRFSDVGGHLGCFCCLAYACSEVQRSTTVKHHTGRNARGATHPRGPQQPLRLRRRSRLQLRGRTRRQPGDSKVRGRKRRYLRQRQPRPPLQP